MRGCSSLCRGETWRREARVLGGTQAVAAAGPGSRTPRGGTQPGRGGTGGWDTPTGSRPGHSWADGAFASHPLRREFCQQQCGDCPAGLPTSVLRLHPHPNSPQPWVTGHPRIGSLLWKVMAGQPDLLWHRDPDRWRFEPKRDTSLSHPTVQDGGSKWTGAAQPFGDPSCLQR